MKSVPLPTQFSIILNLIKIKLTKLKQPVDLIMQLENWVYICVA